MPSQPMNRGKRDFGGYLHNSRQNSQLDFTIGFLTGQQKTTRGTGE